VVGDEILVEGTDVSKDRHEGAICRHLGLAEPLILNYYGFVSHISGGDPLDDLSIESLELGMITITPTPRYTISP